MLTSKTCLGSVFILVLGWTLAAGSVPGENQPVDFDNTPPQETHTLDPDSLGDGYPGEGPRYDQYCCYDSTGHILDEDNDPGREYEWALCVEKDNEPLKRAMEDEDNVSLIGVQGSKVVWVQKPDGTKVW
jgi:hypothetical protein